MIENHTCRVNVLLLIPSPSCCSSPSTLFKHILIKVGMGFANGLFNLNSSTASSMEKPLYLIRKSVMSCGDR